MKLLDLFCGAGGASMGYHRAGFEVVGVDIEPQPRYPFEFYQADALEYMAEYGHKYDVIHASPPCQFNSSMTNLTSTKFHIDLIPQTRHLLRESGKPYIIENVIGAKLINPLTLCGTMFGLKTMRHRLFECNPIIWMAPAMCNHSGELYTILTKSCRSSKSIRAKSSHKKGCEVMGIDWMTQYELGLSIPPAYTEWLGQQIKANS